MRIGLVALHTSPLAAPGAGDAGGMNVVVRALADELAHAGHRVEVLTRAASPADLDRLEVLESGARVRFLTAGEPNPLVKEELPRVTDAFARALLALPRFDVLHSHYWLSGRATLPVARETRAVHVLSLHTVAAVKNARLAPGDSPEPAARLKVERTLARRSDAVVASTRSERDAIVAAYGAQAARVHVIEPGVDTDVFRPSAAPTPDARPRVLVVGRIQPLKGQELAVRALARLAPDIRPHLFIAGEASGAVGADYRARLDALVAAQGLARDASFVGALPRAELAELMRSCSLVLVPSRSETFGLVTLEAAASGVPVVAARVPGLVDAVREGVTGVLVDGHDERTWAAAIERMLRDPALRHRMARASLDHARAHSWRATAARMATLYGKAAASI
ncbi:MAG: glycosyltransferase [Nocardiaceae bacterium]|nr:glycosyltransferase [Microbacteriaceae bacterium]MCL2532596.1 glycosyltransferase [Nocardiaceae bacterium]